MRIPLLLALVLVVAVAACQPDPTLTQNGQLVGERDVSPNANIPTLFLPPTNTPVIVPTSAPTSVPQQAPTEVAAIPIATAPNDFVLITPTLPPSKTPTVTPTQTAIPSVTTTPTITVTTPPTATSEQFAFRGQGQTSNAEATAYALNLQQQQARAAQAEQNEQVSSQNAFVPADAPVQNAPAANCAGGPQWFFTELPTATCPTGAADSSNAAFQRFQYGYMFWLEDTNKIYVLYNSQQLPRWSTHPNLWQEGMEECNSMSAASYPTFQGWEPIQGFCMIWMRDMTLAGKIGLAEDRYEYSYIARYQFGQDGTLAIQDNIGSVFYLGPNGDWDLWRDAFQRYNGQ